MGVAQLLSLVDSRDVGHDCLSACAHAHVEQSSPNRLVNHVDSGVVSQIQIRAENQNRDRCRKADVP